MTTPDAIFVIALWVFIVLGLFMLPLPLRCDRGWCSRSTVGYSIYCRKHTDEILRGDTNGK